MQAIRAAAVSQAKIINDLLDLSRVTTGKLALSLHNLDLCELVQEIAGIAGEDPGAAGLRIVCENGGEPLFVYADRVRMEQVVWNLLSNAIKFTPREGDIVLRLGAQDGWVASAATWASRSTWTRWRRAPGGCGTAGRPGPMRADAGAG